MRSAPGMALPLLLLSLLLTFVSPGQAHPQAQPQTGVICVSAFADQNANGQLDPGEGPLAGVNVNLSTGGAIIATHITDAGGAHCFERLLPGLYTVAFTNAPIYRTMTAGEGTFELAPGQRLTIDPFGAAPIELANLRRSLMAQRAAASPAEKPFDTGARLLLATAGALMAMIFMIGLGAIVLGMMNQRRARSAAQSAVRSAARPAKRSRRQDARQTQTADSPFTPPHAGSEVGTATPAAPNPWARPPDEAPPAPPIRPPRPE